MSAPVTIRLGLDVWEVIMVHRAHERSEEATLTHLYQASDAERLAFAGDERRAVVTQNIRDVVLLAAFWAGEDRSHAGIILLEDLLHDHPQPEDLTDSLLWWRANGG